MRIVWRDLQQSVPRIERRPAQRSLQRIVQLVQPTAQGSAQRFLPRVAAFALTLAAAQVSADFPNAVDGQPLPSLAPMLERVMPAVVNISTRGEPQSSNPLMNDPFFRRFFDPRALESAPAPQSTGSGVIIDAEDGLVVTNSHVIEGAASVVVTLNDGRERDAALVGTDPDADIALLRIEAAGLVDIAWADSDELRVGDFSVAIGNPFGLGQTVTSGIISALGRSGLGIEDFEDFVQTDASINPGNSGGALVNLRGELVGINTAIVGPSGGNVGIGFAIPSNMAADLVAQLLEFGEVRRGALGISGQALTATLADALKSRVMDGVVVTRVRAGSPAARAGIEIGDIITAMDGRAVSDMRAVRNRIGLKRIGQRLELDVERKGRPLNLSVVIEELQLANPLLEGVKFADRRTRRGRGVVAIESLSRDSVAARAGLRPGDLVIAVGDRRVETIEALEAAASLYGDELLLLVQRGREQRYVRLG